MNKGIEEEAIDQVWMAWEEARDQARKDYEEAIDRARETRREALSKIKGGWTVWPRRLNECR